MCTGFEPLLFGTAATGTAAATTGLIGAGGALTAGGALSAAATALNVMGSLSGGNQRRQQADYQAAQAAADAQAMREQATIDADRARKAGQRQRSQAIAQLAASGVEVGSGTALKIGQTIDAGAEQDAQTTLLTGRYRSENLDRNADLLRVAGSNAQTAGYYGAGSSLLAGAAKVGGGWQKSPQANAGYDYDYTYG